MTRALRLLPLALAACAPPPGDDTDRDDTDRADTEVAPPTWRDTLDVCWLDLACDRAFVISHGGDWTIADFPYDSAGAFHRAADKGADGIKTDVHVTRDGVAVVAHSSPIEPWESTDCAGLRIEELTADEVTACHLAPSDTETFQRVDDVLEWARGRVVIMLTVKEPVDFPRAIETVIEHDALDYVFLETGTGDLRDAIPASPDWARATYNVAVSSEPELDALLDDLAPSVGFLEVNVDWQEAEADAMPALLAETIHPAGLRGFVSSIHLPTAAQHRALWDQGFDVIMTYALDAAIEARTAVNAERGIDP
jgi:glycerophosphoryl diester phosphodiesterase